MKECLIYCNSIAGIKKFVKNLAKKKKSIKKLFKNLAKKKKSLTRKCLNFPPKEPKNGEKN